MRHSDKSLNKQTLRPTSVIKIIRTAGTIGLDEWRNRSSHQGVNGDGFNVSEIEGCNRRGK